ncbi:hypothetical protein HMPREF9123_2022 [Neisseria bacilliformis ATCC BAA-1200]|uniref:Uncharacterized protein n=1 Tax=Neisseria bacilliformis ATCC BAA-1200 TaxID=888742 RepID=F2BE66_9NEIS|nr:hypothetical protein HMPREF9123_2022 [Neisseria bacilliformis ATCC BAA-1200]
MRHTPYLNGVSCRSDSRIRRFPQHHPAARDVGYKYPAYGCLNGKRPSESVGRAFMPDVF